MPADVGRPAPTSPPGNWPPSRPERRWAPSSPPTAPSRGTVGAIVGLRSRCRTGRRVGQVDARPAGVGRGASTSCDQEVVALRKRDVAALALAVPPDLARRSAASAARMGWRPAGGLLLAPSAVYAHLERDLVTQGARSAVALSPANTNDAGTARFRRACSGVRLPPVADVVRRRRAGAGHRPHAPTAP